MPTTIVASPLAEEWFQSQTGSSAESEIGRNLNQFFGHHLADRRPTTLPATWELSSEMLLFYTDLGNPAFQAGQTLQSSVLTYQIEKALFLLSSRKFNFPQPNEVRDYLLRYPDMTDLALSVCAAVSARFGAYAQLSLEVYHDPEIEDEYLTLYVRQQDYAENLLDGLEEISEEYEEELAERTGWLLVTTDFGPPRIGNHGF